ncbi:MAG: insulinase family protein [Verrucomicrobiae bacterium]|nr:insulinase family protein [Verrucomicrobiae bacterium]
MISRLLSASFLLAGLLAPLRASDPIPLAQENSDIPTDSAVTWGLLENGLRYAILPNPEPPSRVSMRLFIDAGSLMENDDQQGLAHFLEHMAFNGTKNFPAGEMVEYFQRLGMGFGSHTNAHTSFHETVYKLELPKSDAAMIDEGMKLFRDYADGMLLDSKEIEDERGIILSEKRTRDSVGWRTFVEQIGFAFPQQRISKRMPIGIEEVISGAPRERFVEFYNEWYTPNRMVVIVVGDVEVAAVEPIVKKYFGDLSAREKKPEPPMGEMSKRGFAVHYHHEDEAGETSVSIEALKPRVNPPDNSERRLHDLQLTLAGRMVDRRLERLAKAPDSPISSASMSAGDFYDLGFALYSSIDADCKPENWKAAMTLIEQELRRALEHGFTQAELDEVRANFRVMYEEAAKQVATRRSSDLADQIADRLGSRRVFTNPADDLPRVLAALDQVTTESCRDHLRSLWVDANETLAFVSGNAEIEDAVATIKSVVMESRAVAVSPPEEKEVGAFAYSDVPESGKVAEREEVEDLGVTRLRFDNGVRVNLKVTDFEDAVVYVKARMGAGLITEPVPGLNFFLGSIFTKGGLEAHSEDDLQAIFAGKSVDVNFSVDDDAFTLSGQTTPEAIEDQLLLMRAFVTNPGFREEAETEFKRALDYLYQQLERTPGGFAQDEVAAFLHGGDKRFGFPSRSEVEALSTSQAREWVMPELEKGYCEVTVVGDFDKEAAIALLAKTFGNLPERMAEKPAYEKERIVKFPAGGEKEFLFESEIPKAMSVVHWPTADIFDIKKTRRLGMLSAILDDRLRVKVREELGDAYSPFAHNLPSDTWKDYGYLFASVTVDPPQAEKVNGVIADIAKDLATGTSITEDELERAKKPQVVSIEEMRRTNRYWMSSVLEASQEYPARLEWSRSFVDDYKNITIEEINALAKEYLRDDTRVSVVIKPKAPTEAPASGQ